MQLSAQVETLSIIKTILLSLTASPIVFSLKKYMDDQLDTSSEFKT